MTNSAIVISDSVITIDMSPMVGYSMSLRIEKPDSCKSLSWTSWSQAEQVCTGGFLEDPGVPVQALLDAGVFSNTPAKILELAADVPALQYLMLQAMLKQPLQSNWHNPILCYLFCWWIMAVGTSLIVTDWQTTEPTTLQSQFQHSLAFGQLEQASLKTLYQSLLSSFVRYLTASSLQ